MIFKNGINKTSEIKLKITNKKLLKMTKKGDHLTSQGWPEILGSSLIVVVAFLPFFTYKELESVIGARRLRGILFGAKVPEGDLVAK